MSDNPSFKQRLDYFQKLTNEGNAPAAAGLQRFLDIAWSNRLVGPGPQRTIVTDNDGDPSWNHYYNVVYGLYSKAQKTFDSPHVQAGYLAIFLSQLYSIPLVPEIQTTQGELLYEYITRGRGERKPSGFAQFSNEKFRKLASKVTKPHYNWLADELCNTFYHYRNFGEQSSKTRIYLNVQLNYAPLVMSFIVEKMLGPGLIRNAKVAPPGKEMRADTIVIYLASERDVAEIVKLVAEYQTRNDGWRQFRPGVPRSTHEITREQHGVELVGVGTGAEPPKDQVRRLGGGSSFGSFRAMIIADAMCVVLGTEPYKSLPDQHKKKLFVELTYRYFREYGIDPGQPHLHRSA